MRELVNAPGVVFDADDLVTLYAEDWNELVAFVEGISGGVVGAQIYVASGVPSDSLGLDGDLYINSANGNLYQKLSSTWGSPLFNIMGPAGAVGATGATGPTGPAGTVDLFTSIPDVPHSYTGYGSDLVAVSPSEDGLSFVPNSIWDYSIDLIKAACYSISQVIFSFRYTDGPFDIISSGGHGDGVASYFYGPELIDWSRSIHFCAWSQILHFVTPTKFVFGPWVDTISHLGVYNSAYFYKSGTKFYAGQDNGSSAESTDITSYVTGLDTSTRIAHKFEMFITPGVKTIFKVDGVVVATLDKFAPVHTGTFKELCGFLVDQNSDSSDLEFYFPMLGMRYLS